MSEEIVIPSEPVVKSNKEITKEEQLALLTQWKQIVEQEIAGYEASKDKIYQLFKIQKERFDRLLAEKIKKMKKYDIVLTTRKKVLNNIIVEIEKLTPPKI